MILRSQTTFAACGAAQRISPVWSSPPPGRQSHSRSSLLCRRPPRTASIRLILLAGARSRRLLELHELSAAAPNERCSLPELADPCQNGIVRLLQKVLGQPG